MVDGGIGLPGAVGDEVAKVRLDVVLVAEGFHHNRLEVQGHSMRRRISPPFEEGFVLI